MKYYILKEIGSNNSLDFDGEYSNTPYRYYNLSEAYEAKERVGNCYIDLKKDEE